MSRRKIEVPNIGPNTLLFLLDDTGHEQLARNHEYYGLGGIGVWAAYNESHLKPAWRAFRAEANGDPEKLLHAFEFGQQAKQRPQLYDTMNRLFREHPFLRLAVTASIKTTYPDRFVLMQPVILMLKKQIADFVNRAACDSVALVFESSERADNALIDYFGKLEDVRVPVEYCLLEKKYGEPSLEIADFVANAAGSMARWRLAGKSGFPKDFAGIFQSVPAMLVKYMDIGSVEGPRADERAVGHELGP